MRMIHKSFILGLTLLLASCFASSVLAKEAPKMVKGKKVVFVKLADNFIILHDSSSSMKAKSGDQMRLDIERQILTENNCQGFGSGDQPCRDCKGIRIFRTAAWSSFERV